MALPIPLALTQTRAQEVEAHTQRDSDINEIETGAERVTDISTFLNIKNPKFSPKTTTATPA